MVHGEFFAKALLLMLMTCTAAYCDEKIREWRRKRKKPEPDLFDDAEFEQDEPRRPEQGQVTYTPGGGGSGCGITEDELYGGMLYSVVQLPRKEDLRPMPRRKDAAVCQVTCVRCGKPAGEYEIKMEWRTPATDGTAKAPLCSRCADEVRQELLAAWDAVTSEIRRAEG